MVKTSCPTPAPPIPFAGVACRGVVAGVTAGHRMSLQRHMAPWAPPGDLTSCRVVGLGYSFGEDLNCDLAPGRQCRTHRFYRFASPRSQPMLPCIMSRADVSGITRMASEWPLRVGDVLLSTRARAGSPREGHQHPFLARTTLTFFFFDCSQEHKCGLILLHRHRR